MASQPPNRKPPAAKKAAAKPAPAQNAAHPAASTAAPSATAPAAAAAAAPTRKGIGKVAPPKTIKRDPISGSAWIEYKTSDGLIYYYNEETKDSMWDKPEDLMETEEKEKMVGDWFWIPHPDLAYFPGRVNITYTDGSKLTELEGGQTITVPKGITIHKLLRSQLRKIVDDLVMLEDMNHPLILHNLRERCKKDKIYTYVGTILVAINPYKLLPYYTPAMIDKYARTNTMNLPPHPYSIAKAAYTSMLEYKQNHSIIVSGESGAGKTETFKIVLGYLAEVAGSPTGVEQLIVASNPILESFGNAKTIRNNNSSRFGKWVEIHFDKSERICGAKIINYLLEKTRVTKQAANERSYHIFYQLCIGASQDMKKKYNIGAPDQYHFLKQSGCLTVDSIDDAKDFTETLHALHVLRFTDAEIDSVLKVISAVLHLGNIQFADTEENKAPASKVTEIAPLEYAAKLLQVSVKDLVQALTHKRFQVPGHAAMSLPLIPTKARDARDSLAGALYGNMFSWLVQRISDLLSKGIMAGCKLIGVLDVAGFEVFEDNARYAKVLKDPNAFTIKHYAGPVTYDATGFLDKNKDTMNDDLYDLIKSSKEGLIHLFFTDFKGRKVSLGGQFKDQLNALMVTLNATEPHYIRCIKPNSQKAPASELLDSNAVLSQLTYSGVFEAVSIRQIGFPFRYSHENFFKRFRILSPELKPNKGDYKAAAVTLIKTIATEHKKDFSRIQVGGTKILYKAEEHRTLELLRFIAIEKALIRAQATYRGYLARCLYERLSAVRAVLRAAITARSLEKLNAALAQIIEFEMIEVGIARDLRDLIIEEQKVLKLINDIH